MIKKKDPYIALLDFYYEKFPEAITLKEVYAFFHRNGYISDGELEIMNAFGATRFEKKDPEIEQSASRKRRLFEILFMRAGDCIGAGGRNSEYVLNSDHYFHRLEYIELQEARKSSRLAFITSMLAILISFGSFLIAWDSSKKPTTISDSQINTIVRSIESHQETERKQSEKTIKILQNLPAQENN